MPSSQAISYHNADMVTDNHLLFITAVPSYSRKRLMNVYRFRVNVYEITRWTHLYSNGAADDDDASGRRPWR